MNWSCDQTLEFLDLYQAEDLIWNPKHRLYKKRNAVAEAWHRIKESFSLKCSVFELKRKKESLMSTYRTHITKRRQCPPDEEYHTSWFAFELMDSFLAPIYDRPTELVGVVTIKSEPEDETSEPQSPQTSNHRTSVGWQSNKRVVRHLKNSKLVASRKQMDVALTTLKTIQERTKDTDEVVLYCQLLAKRIKKFEESVRDTIMWKIDQIIHGFMRKKHRAPPQDPIAPSPLPHSPTSYNTDSDYEMSTNDD